MLRNVLGTLGNYYYRGNKLTFCQLHVHVTVASFYFLSVSKMESRSMALMHISSAIPRGRTPDQPGDYVEEYKGMDKILCPWVEENS